LPTAGPGTDFAPPKQNLVVNIDHFFKNSAAPSASFFSGAKSSRPRQPSAYAALMRGDGKISRIPMALSPNREAQKEPRS
jgi:hypothetical protein